jgi:pseudaminic acid synthase
MMKIGDFEIGKGKVFIIAELSANHKGDINIAKETILAAKEAGADAIKLQTYTADTITLDVRNDHFLINQGTSWDGVYLYDLYKEAYTPWEWHKELFAYASELGLESFSSPFDNTAVDFLEKLNVPAYKIASFEITDIPLIEYTASKGKPIIISTGIATEEDILLAVDACKKVGNQNICLLKCTSQYPAKLEDANLDTMVDLKNRFNVESGLSDHTLGSEVCCAATAMGAVIIEKHIILDKSIGGPDAHFSLDKDEFKAMVKTVRLTEKIVGKVDYKLTESKKNSRNFSRSLFVCENISKGEIFNSQNVRSVRPGVGLHPKYLNEVIGKISSCDLVKGTPMSLEYII